MTEEEQQAIWDTVHPNRKMPGSFEPQEDCCASKLISKDLRELNLTRYCTKSKGFGTNHQGEGSCKHHLGNTQNHVRGAMRAIASKELVVLSKELGEAAPIGPPELEAFRLASKVKQWSLVLEKKMDELNGLLVVTDQAGIEHTRALIELTERAWDRLQKTLEFLLKHDLQKRVIALEENQVNLITQVFFNLIMSNELGLKEEQVRTARHLFAVEISKLGSQLEPSWASGVIDDEEIVDAEIV